MRKRVFTGVPKQCKRLNTNQCENENRPSPSLTEVGLSSSSTNGSGDTGGKSSSSKKKICSSLIQYEKYEQRNDCNDIVNLKRLESLLEGIAVCGRCKGTLANAPDPFSSYSGGLWLAHFSMCQPISLLHSLLSEARAEWLVANQSLLCGLWTPATLQFKSSLPRHAGLCLGGPSIPQLLVAPEATSHIPPPGNTTQEVVMPTSLPSPQQSALGTQEVPLHTEAPIHGKALSEEGSTSAEEAKSLQDIEDQLLNSPSTPKSTGTLDDATEQLGNLRMKRPNLTTAQRREALKAKLLEKGEAFDPSKWRRGKKKRKKNQERQEVSTPGPTAGAKAGVGSAKRPRGTFVTPPSAEGPAKKARRETQKPEAHDPEASGSTPKATYREVAAIKMAIALEGYPEAKLSAEQGEAIEDAIMEEIQPLEDGSVPSFAGTYLEKGVLIASCINEHTKRWLEEVIQRIKPLGDDISLRVGLRKDILRSTRVFFRAHPKLLKKTPEKVLEMFNKQNPNLNVNEWKILPSKPDPKGYGFVCFLDEVCYKAPT
ncbi:hypothetical protein J6590_084857 [Homalodisca vitripennis]|nr:hypothetical protein J6590_084857 [Homalodisca vitripennis]